MWMERLAAGVVRVQTAIGPRYLVLSWQQRVYLMWMFRNFSVLPHTVLSSRQQSMIERMCSEQRFASSAYSDVTEAPVIGTIERRPSGAELLPPRRPAISVTVSEPRIMPVEASPRS